MKNEMNTAKLNRSAYGLWLRFKTTTSQYKQIAQSLGLTTLQLNALCHDAFMARRA